MAPPLSTAGLRRRLAAQDVLANRPDDIEEETFSQQNLGYSAMTDVVGAPLASATIGAQGWTR